MSTIQESALGQIIYLLSNRKYFAYPEDSPDFKLPWEESEPSEKGNDDNTPAETPSERDANEDGAVDEVEKPPLNTRPTGMSRIPTARSMEEGGDQTVTLTTTRTLTRERTTPYSRERFEIEQAEDLERKQNSVILPQKTTEGYVLVDWYTTDDPANPQNWNSWKKVFVGLQIFLYTFAVYCTSAIYTPSQEGVMHEFGVGYAKGSLGLSMYVIGYGVGPMIFSPLSEIPVVGRNLPYIVSFGLFVILCVPTALADSYASLLVLRFLTGFMGSPCLATGGATMQDMYGLLKLPYALTAWVAAAFSAPALGPLLSGFAVMAKGWRWSLWEALWMSGPVFVLMFIAMPETSADNILLRRAKRLRRLTGRNDLRSQSEINQGNTNLAQIIADQMIKPTEIFLRDPAVFFTNVYTSLIYGIYYSYFEAFPIVYIGIYGFNVGQLGVVFLCIIVGCIVGTIIYVSYVYFYLEPDIKKNGLRAQEQRLVPALFSSMLLPAGMFWFGWTSQPDTHWIVSIIGLTFFGIGAFILFQCIFMYLPLTYPKYAASMFAANDLCRSALAAGSIIYGRPLYLNLGIGRGISVLGGLLCGGVIGIWALWYYGASLRARSRFAEG